MTEIEALQKTITLLSGISVPVLLNKQISEPISVAVNNLNEIIRAIKAAQQKVEEGNEPAVKEEDL